MADIFDRVANPELATALKLVRSTMTPEQLAGLSDDALWRMLQLCQKNNGLVLDDGFLFAYFRYWPERGELVHAGDMGELEKLDLRTGPLLHIVGYVAPVPSFRLVRDLIRDLNPWGVTCARFSKASGQWRFAARKNRSFRGDKSCGSYHQNRH